MKLLEQLVFGWCGGLIAKRNNLTGCQCRVEKYHQLSPYEGIVYRQNRAEAKEFNKTRGGLEIVSRGGVLMGKGFD